MKFYGTSRRRPLRLIYIGFNVGEPIRLPLIMPKSNRERRLSHSMGEMSAKQTERDGAVSNPSPTMYLYRLIVGTDEIPLIGEMSEGQRGNGKAVTSTARLTTSNLKDSREVSPAGSVGASAPQRCPLDTRTLSLQNLFLSCVAAIRSFVW